MSKQGGFPMKQSSLSRWLKVILVAVTVAGAAVYLWVLPMLGQWMMITEDHVFDHCFWPWLIFLWVTAIPCCAAVVLGWRIAANIGRDRSFSMENARYMRAISILAAVDVLYFFLGNIVMLFLDMSHPGILLMSLIPDFVGVAVCVAAAALSHLIRKAADLQEQSDLTI